jgi:NAD+ kinase
MSSKTLTFALFGNLYQQEKSVAIRQVLACLKVHGARIIIDEEYYHFLMEMPGVQSIIGIPETPGNPQCPEIPGNSRFSTFRGADFEADFAISMGGDGTLLKTASRVREKQIPIVGVNMGRLGFLADVSADDIDNMIDALYRGDYSVEDRSLIRVETNGEPISGYECALNDVAILKRDSASMISIRTSINGEYLTTYQADGLIVSTPTGSTAYSMSNGGPIIVPRTGVMLMTAVAPHSLNVRPIVIPDSAMIELTVSSRSHSFLVAIDGRSGKLPEGTTLRLTRAPYTVKVAKRSGTRYFATLREKLMWGADVR